MASYYDTLGVKPGSTNQEIRKAYLRRARALHPDRQQGRSPAEARKAEQAMQLVNVAWNVLSDPKKKSEYDKSLKPRSSTNQTRPRQQPTQRPKTPPAQQRTQSTRPKAAASTGAPRNQRRATRSIDDEPGDGSVSVWASLPVLLVLGLVLGILIVTAFAGNNGDDSRRPAVENNAELDIGDCFALVGNSPRERSCASGTSDGQVTSTAPDAGNCPENTQPLKDPDQDFFLCWARMIPGSSNTVPDN